MKKLLESTFNSCELLKEFVIRHDKPLIMFDFETAGMGHHAEPLQLSGIKVDPIKNKMFAFNRKFKPVGRIDPGATAIHGLTKEILKNEPYFEDKAEGLLEFFEGCHLMAYNSNFDTNILINSFKRCKIIFVPGGYIVCPLAIERKFQKKKEDNKLGVVYKRLVKKPLLESRLHEASYDVCCMIEVFNKQLELYKLPMNIAQIGKKHTKK